MLLTKLSSQHGVRSQDGILHSHEIAQLEFK